MRTLDMRLFRGTSASRGEREFCIDNLLVRIHFFIEMIGWTGLAPWEFEFQEASPFRVNREGVFKPTAAWIVLIGRGAPARWFSKVLSQHSKVVPA